MTDSSLTPFSYEGQQVRVVEINGEPWFVGTDVARVLGYVNPSDALGRLVDFVARKLGRQIVAEAVS